jgi:hypothetical protein
MSKDDLAPQSAEQEQASTSPAKSNTLWNKVREIGSSEQFKKIFGGDIYDYLHRLLGIAGLSSFLYTHANPVILGIILILIGGYASAITMYRTNGRFTRHLIFPTILVFIGIFTLSFSGHIRAAIIDNVSSFDLPNVIFRPRAQIRENTLRRTGGTINLYPQVTVQVKDGYVVVKEGDISALELILPPQKGTLAFLVGRTRSEKEFVSEDWANTLLNNQKLYSYVFYVPAEDVTADMLKSSSTWPDILAHSSLYGNVVKNPEYYDQVLRYRRSLIVLTNLERIERALDQAAAQKLVDISLSLVWTTPSSSVLIATRPDTLFKLPNWRNIEPYATVQLIRMRPLEDSPDDLTAFFSGRAFKDFSEEDREWLLDRSKSDPVIHSLIGNKEFADALLSNRNALAKLDDLSICDAILKNYRGLPDQKALKSIGTDRNGFLEKVSEIALAGSQQGNVRYGLYMPEYEILKSSGLVDVDHDAYTFSPDILQSYFAVTAVQRHLKSGDASSIQLSDRLKSDMLKFGPRGAQLLQSLGSIAVKDN